MCDETRARALGSRSAELNCSGFNCSRRLGVNCSSALGPRNAKLKRNKSHLNRRALRACLGVSDGTACLRPLTPLAPRVSAPCPPRSPCR